MLELIRLQSILKITKIGILLQERQLIALNQSEKAIV